ncbi:MAG: GNAT family N-acetyltransferase [Bacteroidales bacterium]|nr:GNAT family N-acetyltransferase [Bacteroidales bacterium]
MEPLIRQATSDDRESILQLLNHVFTQQQRSTFVRGNEYWNWKYQDNPFGNSLITVAEIENRIIGVDVLLPWEFRIRNAVIKALQPCESAVQMDYRGKGIFTKMRIYGLANARKQDVDLMFNFPNQYSLPTNLSLGWQFLGKINWRVKILKPGCVVREMFSKGKAEPVDIDNKYIIDPDHIDHIAQKYISNDGFLKTHRVSGFHRWRYINHPNRSYGMVCSEKNRETTIAVFTINRNRNNYEMIIVDLVGSTDNTIPVIKMALMAGRQMNISFVAIMNNLRFKTNELWKLGFLRRKLKNMVVLPLDSGLENIVTHYSNWSLMAGMHDSI